MRFPVVLNHSVMAGHSPSKTGVNALVKGEGRGGGPQRVQLRPFVRS